MALNVNLTTDSGINEAYGVVFYDKVLLNRLEKKLLFVAEGLKKQLPAGAGATVQFLRPDNLAAITSALTEGANPEGQAYTSTKVTALPVQYGGFIAYSDKLEMEAYDDITERFMELLGYQAGLSLDTICRNTLHSNVTYQYAGGAGSEGATSAVASAAEIRLAVKTLHTADAMEYSDGMLHGIIHPATEADLQSDTAAGGWLDVNKYVDVKNVLAGETGKLYNVRFRRSSNVGVGVGSGSVATYRNFIFSEGAFGVIDVANQGIKTIIHKPGESGVADPLNLNGTIGWKAFFITKVLDANRAIELVAASNF